MAEMTEKDTSRKWSIRHRGRLSQVFIYLGKLFRMFAYQNEWKVLPMAAVIAGLVGTVIRSMLFRSKEGIVMGTLALICVGIWNGCFNSIQVICRERDVVKREHRAGMHISAYVMAHLIYQAILCLLQTALTIYICKMVGVAFPAKGLFTRWMIVDIGITLFLVTFAADVLSLWVSSLAHSTTAAMTIMPFVLIFQLVFSGGMLTLPEWSRPLSELTISRYGITALSAQADYNSSPLASVWNAVIGMRKREISGSFTVGQAVDLLEKKDNPTVQDLRALAFTKTFFLPELEGLSDLPDDPVTEALLDLYGEKEMNISLTLGEVADYLATSPDAQSLREMEIPYSVTVEQILDLVGWENARVVLQQTMGENQVKAEYMQSRSNIGFCWARIVLFTMAYAALTTITLEFIDKDKR